MERLAIDIRGLQKTFRQRKKGLVQALKGINLAIPYGTVLGFLGPNGAGKSTTIKILTGQIRASCGQVRIAGQIAGRFESRRDVGYLPENPSFFDWLTGREFLSFVGSIHGLSGSSLTKSIDRELNRVGLMEAAERRIRTYSKGMVQRLGIAQSLLHNPEILIWDEPMSGLDPVGRALVRNLLLELKQTGKTIFFSSHITADVEQVCDRVAVLVGGRLVADDPLSQIVSRQTSGQYLVTKRLHDGSMNEIVVPDKDLARVLTQAEMNKEKIELIRPRTSSLESYFLSLVEPLKEENV